MVCCIKNSILVYMKGIVVWSILLVTNMRRHYWKRIIAIHSGHIGESGKGHNLDSLIQLSPSPTLEPKLKVKLTWKMLLQKFRSSSNQKLLRSSSNLLPCTAVHNWKTIYQIWEKSTHNWHMVLQTRCQLFPVNHNIGHKALYWTLFWGYKKGSRLGQLGVCQWLEYWYASLTVRVGSWRSHLSQLITIN